MKQVTLSANIMAVLGLTADSDNAAFEATMATIVAKAAKADALNASLTDATNQIETFKLDALNARAEKLVDDAIAALKIVQGDRDKYLRLAKADFEGTESLVKDLKPYKSISAQIDNSSSASAELTELVKMTGRELHMGGKFERLKQLNMAEFKNKYKEYFGSEYLA